MPAHVQPSSPARSKPETLRLGPFGGSRAVLERLCLNTRIHYIAGTPRPQRAGGSPTCPTARRSRQSPGPWALAGRPPPAPSVQLAKSLGKPLGTKSAQITLRAQKKLSFNERARGEKGRLGRGSVKKKKKAHYKVKKNDQ